MPRIHSCFAQHLNESLPPRRCSGGCKQLKKLCVCARCKCRKKVDINEARKLVENGLAEWLIIGREPVPVPEICHLCLNDALLKKSCSNCNKTGEIIVVKYSLIRSNDIVEVSRGSGEPGKEIFRSAISKQTPRSATIEKSHIERAYVYGQDEEQQRIEEYGRSTARLLNSFIVPFKADPNEGRILFPFGADERSFPRVARR